MREDIIELTIPSKPEYISVARLTCSSIGSKMGLNIDDIEDIKVCIAEACVNALRKDDKVSMVFHIKKDKLMMKVDNVFHSEEEDMESNKTMELGLLIIESLMDQVIFDEKGVEMTKVVEDDIR